MGKTANVYARIEPELKEQAEAILASLGVPASNAINMFYRQVVLHGGLPFAVRVPSSPIDASVLSDEQLDAVLERGYEDVLAGRVRSAKRVFSDIRKDYGL